jgi:3-hydroxyacyl-CoA dehydrogenase
VSTIAVIGARALGQEIACSSALAGYRTILEDILPSSLRRAEDQIRLNLDRFVGAKEISADEIQAAMQHLEYADSVEAAAREADFVIECVPDELESKFEIFILLDKVCRPNTILACTSLTLSVNEIAGATYRAPKCVGTRFRNSDRSTKLLEIVQAAEIDDRTLALTVEVATRMKMETLIVREPLPEFLLPQSKIANR